MEKNLGDLLLFVWCMLTLALKTELERTKSKLSKIAGIKRRGTIVHSRARWYEHGEQNSRYFYNLEKRNQKKKHITSLVNNDSENLKPEGHLGGGRTFFRRDLYIKIYEPQLPNFQWVLWNRKCIIRRNRENVRRCHVCSWVWACVNNYGKQQNSWHGWANAWILPLFLELARFIYSK